MHSSIFSNKWGFLLFKVLLVTILSICTVPSVLAQNGWTMQFTPVSFGTLSDIFFTDEATGWAVGRDDRNNQAVIVHTTNGGAQWTL